MIFTVALTPVPVLPLELLDEELLDEELLEDELEAELELDELEDELELEELDELPLTEPKPIEPLQCNHSESVPPPQLLLPHTPVLSSCASA